MREDRTNEEQVHGERGDAGDPQRGPGAQEAHTGRGIERVPGGAGDPGFPATGASRSATTGRQGEAGAIDVSTDRELGGTSSHHRASYSDPTPAAGELLAAESDIDEATGHRTPGPGSPEWMRQPMDQSGFGAHIAEEASSRKSEFRDVRTGETTERGTHRGDRDPSAG